MKSYSLHSSRALSRLKILVLSGALALTLAASPLLAFAGNTTNDAAVNDALDLSELPLASVTHKTDDLTLSADTQTTSLTVYYCEIMPFDESIDHPSNMRLLQTKTFDGLPVGETFNSWDYVENLEGYFFFDGWAESYVLSENPEENNLQLHYFATQNNSATVNYYIMSEDPTDDYETYQSFQSDLVEIGGESILFTKLGEYQLEGLRFNRPVAGEDHAVAIDDLMFVESFPSSIQVSTSPEDNIINLLYAPALTTLPDDSLVDEGDSTTPPAVDDPVNDDNSVDDSTSADDNEGAGDSNNAGDNGSTDNNTEADKPAQDAPSTGSDESSNASSNAGATSSETPDATSGSTESTNTTNKSEAAANTSTPAHNEAPSTASAMPQTGDSLGVLFVAAVMLICASATVLLWLRHRRNTHRNK